MSRRALIAIAVTLGFSVPGCAETTPPNFGVVIKRGIYRGGQPNEGQLHHLRRRGVRTILKLNNHDLEEEREAARRYGMKLIHVSFEPSSIGTSTTCKDVARALAILEDQSNWPIYVHCTKGSDRTGYIVGAYRELVQKWSWPQVDRELKRYGYEKTSRRSYPLIERELKAGAPTCAIQIRHRTQAAR